MQLHSMGISVKHEDTFLIDRPVGLGDYLLLIFKSDAKVYINGKWEYVKEGGFIVYRKGSEQKYGAYNRKYINHYIHFDCEKEDFLEEIGLWMDQCAYLQNLEEIENLLRLLSREYISRSQYHEENEGLLLELLFRKLSENQCKEVISFREHRYMEALTTLRSEMYSTPGKYGSIREMAQGVNLSLSHFQSLYREYFSISCYEDVLNARITSAKEFLRHSNMPIREIANLCGYESDTCFMRCFKKREGMTPSEYRGDK